MKNWGVKYPAQTKEIKEKTKQTCLKKFGYNSYCEHPNFKLINRLYAIKRIENQSLNGEPLTPCIGKFERECFNELESIFNIKIERNQKMGGYFPDGRISELRLLLEFDEPFHYTNGYSQRDIDRENYLASQGYIMFRIKEIDWIRNREKIIQNLKIIIQELTEIYEKTVTRINDEMS